MLDPVLKGQTDRRLSCSTRWRPRTARLSASLTRCTSAATCRRRAGSTPRSTGSRRSAATACRCSRRARACGGRRRTSPRRSSASRRGARRRASRGVVCHALYLCNLAAPTTRSTGSRSRRCARRSRRRSAIEADAVIFHVGSHLGAGFEAWLERVVAGARADPRGSATATRGSRWRTRPGPAARSAARSTSSRRSLDALDRHPRLGICLDSCHLYASGYDVTDPAAVDALVAEVDETIGLDRLRALHVNDSATPLGSNRDRHANILEGEIGEGLGAFLAHPAFQELCAYLEVPAPGDGPDANELAKVRGSTRAGRPDELVTALQGACDAATCDAAIPAA